ncbi:helix-turn-helix transcriptional regulator [Cupriavidus pauculus]|nr:LuxR C-terminal-related transcriptional regulator [Cupriavidus pauculus]GJG96696.1 helix-turn-helix transcriptional regulator [Cupriavidus pauculus]
MADARFQDEELPLEWRLQSFRQHALTVESTSSFCSLPGQPMRTAPAKFSVPQPVRTHMPRERLAAPVVAADGIRLVSVHAPAGFGKTGAMLDILSACMHEGVRTAWIQLGPADNDLSIFLSALDVAVDMLGDVDRQTEPSSDTRPGPLMADTLVERLTQFAAPFAIFLDDLESLHNPATLEFMRQLIAQLPAHGRFVIGSRGVPDLGLGRLRAHGRLLEVTAEQLRFTPEETAAYLARCAPGERVATLSASDLRRLHRRTEGWVVAIWLAVLAMRRRDDVSGFIDSFSGSDVAVSDYLAEDVLSRQPPDVYEFLLKTALLNPFSASLCNAVTERDDGAAMIERLAHENLFLVSIDAAGQWYRYHSLFADFLKARLAQRYRPDEVARMHRLAGAWFAAQARPVPATEHALKAGDVDTALGLLRQHADVLLWQGRVRLLARWFDVLPAGSLANDPRLRLVHAWALTFLHRSDMALALLEGMREAGERDAEIAAHMLALHAFILALTDKLDRAHAAWQACARQLSSAHGFPYGVQLNSLASCHIYLGHFDEARSMLDASRHANAEIGGSANIRIAQCLEGSIDLTQGRLRQALVRYRGAHDPHGSDRQPRELRVDGQEIAGAFLAEALYEAGRLREAQRLLSAYQPLIREAAYIDPIIVTFVLLCRMSLADGCEDDAMLWLHDCEQMGYRTGLLRMVASARLERGRIALLRGDREGARAELAAASALDAWSFGPAYAPHANDLETIALLEWRLAIATGNDTAHIVTHTVTPLRAALAEAEAATRGRRALKLRILLALALRATGDDEGALHAIGTAIDTAASEGFVSTFVDEGDGIAALLRGLQTRTDLATSDASRALIREVLQQMPCHHDAVTSAEAYRLTQSPQASAAESIAPADIEVDAAHPDGLTGRELNVLGLLAEGLSNKIMAQRLFVSETTIKTHLRNINSKLDATSRTHAVAVARKRGLIR